FARLRPFPTRRSSDLARRPAPALGAVRFPPARFLRPPLRVVRRLRAPVARRLRAPVARRPETRGARPRPARPPRGLHGRGARPRSEEHTSELQSRENL